MALTKTVAHSGYKVDGCDGYLKSNYYLLDSQAIHILYKPIINFLSYRVHTQA